MGHLPHSCFGLHLLDNIVTLVHRGTKALSVCPRRLNDVLSTMLLPRSIYPHIWTRRLTSRYPQFCLASPAHLQVADRLDDQLAHVEPRTDHTRATIVVRVTYDDRA